MDNHLPDADYFQQYCAGINIVFNSSNDEIAFVKDHDFVFRLASQGFVTALYGEQKVTPADVLGRTSCELKINKDSKRLEDIFCEQDELVRDKLTTLRFLFVDSHNRIFIVTKRPIINPATNNFVGIFSCMRNFMYPHILNLIYKMNGVNYGIANSNPENKLKYTLTERQHMVLFLCVNKYSNTEISSIMTTLKHKISAGRVNDHLENLRYIFAVKSKEQLIEKALSYNYHLFIPRKFLKVGSYLLEDEVIISDN